MLGARYLRYGACYMQRVSHKRSRWLTAIPVWCILVKGIIGTHPGVATKAHGEVTPRADQAPDSPAVMPSWREAPHIAPTMASAPSVLRACRTPRGPVRCTPSSPSRSELRDNSPQPIERLRSAADGATADGTTPLRWPRQTSLGRIMRNCCANRFAMFSAFSPTVSAKCWRCVSG